jgi:hypothetical protein
MIEEEEKKNGTFGDGNSVEGWIESFSGIPMIEGGAGESHAQPPHSMTHYRSQEADDCSDTDVSVKSQPEKRCQSRSKPLRYGGRELTLLKN